MIGISLMTAICKFVAKCASERILNIGQSLSQGNLAAYLFGMKCAIWIF